MVSGPFKILVCDPLAEDGLKILRDGAEVDVRLGLPPAELRRVIGDYDGLVVRSETKVTADIIENAAALKVIGRAGVGVDNIDVEAASRKGVVVVNAPASNIIAAAEHTVALMLALARQVPQADASMRAGEWQRSRYVGSEVRNKILGVVGLGRIGAEVAKRAQGLMMRVVAYDPFVSEERASKLGIKPLTLEQLLRDADFVTLHMPLTTATRGIIGARELAWMKPTARLINCARGGLVDETALAEALGNGRLAGAALDVFAQEPPKGSPLLSSDLVVLTPHLGASTHEAQVGVAVDVAEQVLAVLRGEPAAYAVNAPVFSPETLKALGQYLALAEQVGLIFAQLQDGQIGTLDVMYNGKIAEYDTGPLTASLLKGLLQGVSEEQVSLMNATLLARSRGLVVREHRSTEPDDNFANTVSLRTTQKGGISDITGTVVHREPHIVRLGDYRVDITPGAGYLLVAEYKDQPGMIGRVGTIMGDASINVSFMQVGRTAQHGSAMMVLCLDDPVPSEVQERIRGVASVRSVRVVRL